MPFQLLNPLEHADWNAKFASTGTDSFFNTVEWARTLAEAYGYVPIYVTADAADVPLLLPIMDVSSWLTGRRGVALPFSDYCEPIGLEPAIAPALLDFLQELGARRKWRYFEIRSARGLSPEIPASGRFWRHDLDLTPGADALLKVVESSVRTAIRKAIKANVKVSFLANMDALHEFYTLNCLTRQRHGLPPQPFAFFRSLHRNVLATGKGTLVLARHANQTVAASLFCHHGKTAIYKYGASDYRFQELRGSTLVMWKAISKYAQEGYAQLALGRTALSNAGLRRFKLGWGATETEAQYIRYDFRRQQFVTGEDRDTEAGYAVVRMMPLAISRLAGQLLYRHMA